VRHFSEIIAVSPSRFHSESELFIENQEEKDNSLSELSQDALFEKLQNYKKLLDNGFDFTGRI
jgi:hypothetical protein